MEKKMRKWIMLFLVGMLLTACNPLKLIDGSVVLTGNVITSHQNYLDVSETTDPFDITVREMQYNGGCFMLPEGQKFGDYTLTAGYELTETIVDGVGTVYCLKEVEP